MESVITVAAISVLSLASFQFIPMVLKDLQCQWLLLDQKHQYQIKKRVNTYINMNSKSYPSQCINNNKGQTTLLSLLLTLFVLFMGLVTMSWALTSRKAILEREKIMACTGVIEKKALELNKQIEKLNKLILNLRILELSNKASPVAGSTLQTLRITAEEEQQSLALMFLNSSKLPSKECKTSLFSTLLLYQNNFLHLKRHPLWRTALIKEKSNLWINHSSKTMRLTLIRNKKLGFVGLRRLVEKTDMKDLSYGNI